jgi:Flp pilus assembly protein protease CpaA
MLDIAFDLFLIGIALYILISDIRFHRIPNISLLFLIIALLYSMHQISAVKMMLFLIFIWILGIFSKVGMGDLKLLTILIVLQGEVLIDSRTWIFLTVCTVLSIIFHRVVERSLKGEIPLAPAILVPFVSVYLTF